jgi:hypothetical protein
VDWHRLNLATADDARRLLENHDISLNDPGYRLHGTREERGDHLPARHFQFSIPKPVEESSVAELLLLASSKGHRQLCACTILKTIQIINHMAGASSVPAPVSDRDLFHLVEEKVYRVVGTMLSEGFPITEFIGGRKNLDSTYTKLLSKPEGDCRGALRQAPLSHRHEGARRHPARRPLPHRPAFPVQLRRSRSRARTRFSLPAATARSTPSSRAWSRSFKAPSDDDLTPGDNRFSAPTYRVIQFVTDVPVRVPPHLMELAPAGSELLGPLVYMLCEFQVLDAESEAKNETGDASHDAYKQAAARRRFPPPSPRKPRRKLTRRPETADFAADRSRPALRAVVVPDA